MKIGAKVTVIDDNLTGYVREIQGDKVLIETLDEFIMSFTKEELVVIPEHDIVSKVKVAEKLIIDDKHKQPKKRIPKKNKKEQPPMEVDLHINQLVKSTKGMSKHDMLTLQLDTAKSRLEFAIKKRIQRIVFIHGVGEGILKLELEYLFGRYDNIKFYDANYQKYGLGATEVYVFQNIK